MVIFASFLMTNSPGLTATDYSDVFKDNRHWLHASLSHKRCMRGLAFVFIVSRKDTCM